MHRFILLLLASIFMLSCTPWNKSYTIETEIEGSQGQWVKLIGRIDGEYNAVDSVQADSLGVAILKGRVKGVQTRYLTVEGQRGSVQLLLENAKYSISGTLDEAKVITKSEAQGDLLKYMDDKKPLETRMSEVYREYREANQSGDSAQISELDSKYEEAYQAIMDYDSLFIASNPASYATILALRSSFYSYETNDLEATLKKLDEKLHNTAEFEYIYGIMEMQKSVADGKPYKDFTLSTPEGETLGVSDVHQGQVLLIDFWASWCGPCRRANPEVVALYNEFHDQGFDILGVSLDSDRDNWLKAIEEDELTWHHISDIKGWECEGSKLYGVPAIPHTVLVDRDGTIRGKKMHGDELRRAIESLL